MSVIDAIIAKKLCGGGGGGSVPKPLTYDYMPEGYPSKAVGTVTLMEEQELAFRLNNSFGLYIGLPTDAFKVVKGQTYTINWDGTEYECVGFEINSSIILGNSFIVGVGNDTGEPFVYEGGFFTSDTSASHTISVKTTAEIVTPMAEEFLPANLATKSDVEVVQTTAENAQTTADKNKEILAGAFSSVATFTFDKQTSGRDTFIFNAFDYYKISDFNPSPSDVSSFKGTRENGDELSEIDTGNNCVQYGLFIVVASAGVCSIPNGSHTLSFTAPSAGLYARYGEDNSSMTAGTAEFTLRNPNGNYTYIAGLFLRSSTTGSTKKFKITVDDSGTISATEVTT